MPLEQRGPTVCDSSNDKGGRDRNEKKIHQPARIE